MKDGKILRHRFPQHFEMCVAECLHLLRRKRSADPTAGPHPAVSCFPEENARPCSDIENMLLLVANSHLMERLIE